MYSQLVEEAPESARLLKWLEDNNPTGFIQLTGATEICYVAVQKGKLLRAYVPSRQSREITPEGFAQLVSQDGVLVQVYRGSPQEIEQASPALMTLFLKMYNGLIQEFMEAVGEQMINIHMLESLAAAP